jgi:hypothetical protein
MQSLVIFEEERKVREAAMLETKLQQLQQLQQMQQLMIGDQDRRQSYHTIC